MTTIARSAAVRAWALGALLLLSSGSALAAIDCSLSTTGVAFGHYDVTLPTPDDTTGTLRVTCTRLAGVDPSNVSYVLALSAGSSGSYATRQMPSGTNRLTYNLFANAARTQVWGNGASATITVAGSLSYNGSQPSSSTSHTIYGRVPALQSVPSGSYSDTIVVTVTF
jgi:spore coat protein U-like protein